MPKLILTLDDVIVKEVQLSKTRSTIGRRPYNDIVIENLAVSGEHAVIENTGNMVILKDLGSTNGTYVNGKPIRKRPLEIGDQIEIGKYKIEYAESSNAPEGDMPADSPTTKYDGDNPSDPIATAVAPLSPLPPSASASAAPTLDGNSIEGPRIRVLNGPSSGKSLALTKVVSTIGNPSVSVASIIRRGTGFDLAHVMGEQIALVNGVSAKSGSIALKHGDHLDVGGVELEFLDH